MQGALFMKIVRGKLDLQQVAGYSAAMVEQIRRCLTRVPRSRPDTGALLKTPAMAEWMTVHAIAGPTGGGAALQPKPAAADTNQTHSSRPVTPAAAVANVDGAAVARQRLAARRADVGAPSAGTLPTPRPSTAYPLAHHITVR